MRDAVAAGSARGRACQDQGSIGLAVHRSSPPPPPRPPKTKLTIVGKNETYRWEIWSGHFWYTNFFWSHPPTSPPSNTSLVKTEG